MNNKIYSFTGNFGELTLFIDGTNFTGIYQDNGKITGEVINNNFKGQWKNKGLEGRIELHIKGEQLTGSWKKGLKEGIMSGKWDGKLIKEDKSNTLLETDHTIQKVYDFFKTICDFDEDASTVISGKLERNLELIKPLYEHFDQIQELYTKEFKPATSFKKLVDFDFA